VGRERLATLPETNVREVHCGYAVTALLFDGAPPKLRGSGDYGRLGGSFNVDAPVGTGPKNDFSEPRTIAGFDRVVQIGYGSNHGCALLEDGTVRCIGSDALGQLAFGGTRAKDSATAETVAGLADAVQIGVGGMFSCALRKDGTVWCWGRNDAGQLGRRAERERGSYGPAFEAVIGRIEGLEHVASISAGGDHACALLEDATVRCWGQNKAGELGDGTTESSPGRIVAVKGLADVAQIVAGRSVSEGHTCALTRAGEVLCWGSNKDGQLGDGTKVDRAAPTRVLF
jgi:alpha-tubulin suppressor-like RCC1 family protein